MSKKKAYVIGTNVSSSLSPTIFNYWFEKYNIDAKYGFKEIEEERFDKEIKLILKEDGLCGLNVTMPFKEKITPYLTSTEPVKSLNQSSDKIKTRVQDYIKELNEKIKLPVNCVSIDSGGIIGKNTDRVGFENACLTKLNNNPTKNINRAIIIGYGGAAKAIIYSLVSMRYRHVIVFNRTFDKIKNLRHVFGGSDTAPPLLFS